MKQRTLKSLSKGLGLRLLPHFRVTLFALAGFFFAGPAVATTVYLEGETDHLLGVEFSIDVVLDSVDDLYGAAFDLKYDPDMLEVVDSDPGEDGIQPKILEGTFLNQYEADTTILRAALEDGAPGTLVIGISRSGDAGGVGTTSDVVILTASFVPKKFGTTSVVFSKQGLKDSNNMEIPVAAWEGLTISIAPLYGNIDGNEIIDLQDAILALQLTSFITPAAPIVYPTAAVNKHGRIGIETAIYVLQFVAELR